MRALRRIAPLALALAACLTARGTAEHPLVRSFELEGVKALSAGDIKEKLATQPSGRFFWQDAQYLDPDALAVDRKRIERYYQTHGYYGAHVTDVELRPAGTGRVDVVVKVDEGEPARVSEVSVTGLETASEAAARVGALPIRAGDVFTWGAYDSARSALLAALHATGYARAEVTAHAEVDPVRRETRITYQVVAGERFRFGNVFVAGAAAVPRERVREEAALAIDPGTTFDDTKLPKAQARVFDLGVFGGVRVSQGQPDLGRKTIPVVVAVREAPFRTIRAGPGIGFQATRWEAHAVAGWTHRNWLGDLRKLSLDARVGYAWLPNPFVTGLERRAGVVGLVTADFTQPGLITRHVDLNLRGELERGLEQAYSFWAERLRVGLPLKLFRSWTLVPSYNLEVYQITGVPAVIGATGAPPTLLQSCPEKGCVLSFLEQRVAWDGRDDAINTRSGLYLSLALQEGFQLFGYGFRYLRLLPEIREFIPLGRRVVLAGRLRVGILRPLASEPTPVVALFTAGGPSSMRGYYTRQFAPAVHLQTGGYVPLGGDRLVDGSAELRVALGGNLGAAAFLDFGNVTAPTAEAQLITHLQYAAGLGVRYRTLFGPLRLDVAGRLPTHTAEGWQFPGVPVVAVENGRIVPTGAVHHDPIISVHLSLGEAF